MSVPLRIVVGEQDPFGVLEQAKRLKHDIPHAELDMIPDAAHMIPALHPELVVNQVKSLDIRQHDEMIKN